MTKANRFKIPALYKKLMAVIAVIGPIYWLMLTDDGRRRTDLVVLYLAGEPTVELRLDTLASAASEERFREFVPDVEWQCENTRTPVRRTHLHVAHRLLQRHSRPTTWCCTTKKTPCRP